MSKAFRARGDARARRPARSLPNQTAGAELPPAAEWLRTSRHPPSTQCPRQCSGCARSGSPHRPCRGPPTVPQ
eukprot:14402969-Alexandrium_andersonii.AAC.1